jgi:hypothetical protein
MKKLDRELPRKVNNIAKQVASAVLEGLVVNMPVDTSQAVSNWQLGYDEANFTNIPPHFPGKAGTTRAQSSAETLAVGRLYIRGKRPGVELHISNGLNYIKIINNKNSMSGFKEKGLAAGREALANAKLDL